jgi:hypothetical protein
VREAAASFDPIPGQRKLWRSEARRIARGQLLPHPGMKDVGIGEIDSRPVRSYLHPLKAPEEEYRP